MKRFLEEKGFEGKWKGVMEYVNDDSSLAIGILRTEQGMYRVSVWRSGDIWEYKELPKDEVKSYINKVFGG